MTYNVFGGTLNLAQSVSPGGGGCTSTCARTTYPPKLSPTKLSVLALGCAPAPTWLCL